MLKSESGNFSFRKTIKIKMWIFILIIIVGFKSAFIPLLDKIWNIQSITELFGIKLINFEALKSVYAILGLILIILGFVGFIRYFILLKNNEKVKIAEIKYGDERNKLITSSTANISTHILLIFLSFAIIISGMFSFIISLTLLFVLLIYLTILFITFQIIRLKY